MIDLNYTKPKKNKDDDEMAPIFQFLIMSAFALFLAYVILSGIAGEPLF